MRFPFCIVCLVFLVAISLGHPGVVKGQAPTGSTTDAQRKVDDLQKKVEDFQKRAEKAEAAATEADQKLKAEVAARQKAEAQAALAKRKETPSTWEGWWREGLREVVWPIARLLGIGGILLLVVLKLDLTSVLRKDQWSERAIVALAIVLTFCGAVLLSLPESVPQELKEIVLVVLGFYFGSSRGDRRPDDRTGADRTPTDKTPPDKKPEDKKPEDKKP